ncbi:hypothetical protein MTR_1g047540 [Medicago truncatula]|uniref:Uncharacterized protein n=1 Tax=Medicago truncatula TaxID=3880 RepID=A0A072VHH3_MEDTR|nr:hypothetical protein MTR_1g047540 [Medicago truncatula]
MPNRDVETLLSYHTLTEPLDPNHVDEFSKIVNDLRQKYRTYVVGFDVEHGVVLLPSMFCHDFGDQLDRLATLVDGNGNEFEVYVEKHKSGVYLTRGWHALRDFYKLTLGSWISMVWQKIRNPVFTPSMKFMIDRSWLPFQMMDAVPTPYAQDEMSFQFSYEKRLTSDEIKSGWLVLAFGGFCALTLDKITTSLKLVDDYGNKWMCTLVYGTIPYRHFKIGGGWKKVVDVRGITGGCHVMICAPADGMNETLYFRTIANYEWCKIVFCELAQIIFLSYQINFYQDPWLRSEYGNWLPAPQNQGVYDLFLSDLLIDGVKEWDVDKIAELFSSEGDKVVWQEESNGLYSVRSGNRIAARDIIMSSHYYVQGGWNAIWKVKAPHKRHVSCTNRCLWCDGDEGTNWHAFVACDVARESWFSYGLSVESADTGGCVVVLLWQLWTAKSDVVWNSSCHTLLGIGRLALSNLQQWKLAQEMNRSGRSTAPALPA